jgi:HEAT repeat protein
VAADDDAGVADEVTRIAAAVFAVSLIAWFVLSSSIVLGRARYERRMRRGGKAPSSWQRRRLVRAAGRRTRTDWGRWRRIVALDRLARMRHPSSPHLLQRALADPDPELAAAAVRSLGFLGDRWAVELLVSALREGTAPRSRIAAQLERLAPLPGPLLQPLLHDPDPAVRFWGATLIGLYPERAKYDLVALTRDVDANVRAAAVEALGARSGDEVAEATLALLEDPAWFVRVHAARAAGHAAGAAGADAVARLLGDEKWWVRTAAKDALETMGPDAIPVVVRTLSASDEFARNGAAEILQNVGLVDRLALEDPTSALLARIYAAGGASLQKAARSRTAGARWPGEVRAA